MSDVEIIGAPQSNFVWATRLALARKGVAHHVTPAYPHSPEVLVIHPLGLIPAMRHGEFTLCESRAVVAYVDAAFDGPSLTATDPLEAARDESWVQMLIGAMDKVLLRQYAFGYFFPGTDDGSPNREMIDAAWPTVKTQLGVLDKAVSDGALLSSTYRLPDLWAIPMLYYVLRLPEAVALKPSVAALSHGVERALARPEVVATMPPPLPGREAA
ncbi:MAG: glutathione S-transferase family protein [Pseudomonadota bacterium]